MLLGKLLKFKAGKYHNIPIKGISFDSRNAKKKDIFFAINGKQTSGDKYINDVISKGVSAIVTSNKNLKNNNKTVFIFVKDTRKILAEACANFYFKKPKNIIAVTGTNGKSSVADFFYQILNFNKIPTASIGTLGICSKNYKKKTSLTSIDSVSLHKNLQILAEKKINNVILEASSHGLDQKRLDHVKIKAGIFTNLSHDHLDYHKNLKSYLNSKIYLFKNLLNKNSKIITDTDNKEFSIIKKIATNRRIEMNTIGRKFGSIKIINNSYEADHQNVKLLINSKSFSLKIPLIGFFQVKNLLMAILAASYCGLDKKKIFKQIHQIKPVTGRLECVAKLNNNSKIIVDFSHTPDALEQSLIELQKQFKKQILIVFGCGGERDKEKRFKMGMIAKKYCKKIFITDDNPRNESPKKIRKEILKACKKKAVEIGDRKNAIQTAIKELCPNEILLVAGKGHEDTQNYGNKILNFSDKKVIKNIINRKYLLAKKNKYKNLILKKTFPKNKIKNLSYNNISINSKTIKKNDLFFAIKGKKIDGHKFVREAIKKGAAKSVVSSKVDKLAKNKIIKVNDTLLALNNLAKIARDSTSAQIIGITGSVGKTTLKNLLSFALKNYGKTHDSPLSYNNKFGVPLSVSNLKEDTKYGVFEIGMDKKGEINNLSKIVKPDISVITNISAAHLKNFNNIKGIAKAKSEIIDNTSNYGNIILNKDDKFFNFLSRKARKKGIKVISFSTKKNADIYLVKTKKYKDLYKTKVSVNKKIYFFETKHSTQNFISNFLACISVLSCLNLELNKINKKLINFIIPNGRGDIRLVKKFNKRFKFIDESYNANPLSMLSAIKNMNNFTRKGNVKKIIFLGDMLELGKKTAQFHKELSVIINKSDIDKVFVFGNYIKKTFNNLSKNKKGKIFSNLEEAYDELSKIIHNNDLLMIKGSNATGLNKFSINLKKDN